MNIFYFTLSKIDISEFNSICVGDLLMIDNSYEVIFSIANEDTKNLILKEHTIDSFYFTKRRFDFVGERALLFSYDGIKKRFGNTKVLFYIINNIDNEVVKSLIENILAISEYKEDRMDITNVLRVHKMKTQRVEIDTPMIKMIETISAHPSENNEEKKDITNTENQSIKQNIKPIITLPYTPSEYYFYDFLKLEEQELWKNLYNQNIPQRSIFRQIKETNRAKFSAALQSFNQIFPNLTIYSRKPKSELNDSLENVSSSDSHNKEFNFIFELLKSKGYEQLSENIWSNTDGTKYSIDIHKIE